MGSGRPKLARSDSGCAMTTAGTPPRPPVAHWPRLFTGWGRKCGDALKSTLWSTARDGIMQPRGGKYSTGCRSTSSAGNNRGWLPLLRRLALVSEVWVIWKNADAALAGSGDIDSAAPVSEWPLIVREFRNWAAEEHLGAVIICRHAPITMFLAALSEDGSTFYELDVSGRKYFRGATLFRAEELGSLSVMDERGFRCLRPGAQGLILLLTNGVRWGGRIDMAGLGRRRIAELLGEDPVGAEAAAARFGLPTAPARAAVAALLRGSWDRQAMLRVEAAALARALADPMILCRRARFRLLTKRRCPVANAIFYNDRQVPGDPQAWLGRVARTHDVYPDPSWTNRLPDRGTS